MNLTILPAYGYPQEISELFSEYTELLIAGNSAFRDYLALQNYDEELDPSGAEIRSALGTAVSGPLRWNAGRLYWTAEN